MWQKWSWLLIHCINLVMFIGISSNALSLCQDAIESHEPFFIRLDPITFFWMEKGTFAWLISVTFLIIVRLSFTTKNLFAFRIVPSNASRWNRSLTCWVGARLSHLCIGSKQRSCGHTRLYFTGDSTRHGSWTRPIWS